MLFLKSLLATRAEAFSQEGYVFALCQKALVGGNNKERCAGIGLIVMMQRKVFVL